MKITDRGWASSSSSSQTLRRSRLPLHFSIATRKTAQAALHIRFSHCVGVPDALRSFVRFYQSLCVRSGLDSLFFWRFDADFEFCDLLYFALKPCHSFRQLLLHALRDCSVCFPFRKLLYCESPACLVCCSCYSSGLDIAVFCFRQVFSAWILQAPDLGCSCVWAQVNNVCKIEKIL